MNNQHRYVSGAIDLREVKARAEPVSRPSRPPPAPPDPGPPRSSPSPRRTSRSRSSAGRRRCRWWCSSAPRAAPSPSSCAATSGAGHSRRRRVHRRLRRRRRHPAVARPSACRCCPPSSPSAASRPLTQFGWPAPRRPALLGRLPRRAGRPQLSGLEEAPAEKGEDPRRRLRSPPSTPVTLTPPSPSTTRSSPRPPGTPTSPRRVTPPGCSTPRRSTDRRPDRGRRRRPGDVEKQFRAADAEIVAGAPSAPSTASSAS